VRVPSLGVALLATLFACGSDESSNPAVSTPLPPVTTPLDGSYDLVITPASGCALPGAPYEFPVVASSRSGSAGTELRATLPGNDSTLAVEMLYEPPGWLQGSVATRTFVVVGSNQIYVRASGTGQVTSTAGGRAEVGDGTMSGDVSVDAGSGEVLTCSSLQHHWSLRAR
jgi:hypothetical protein